MPFWHQSFILKYLKYGLGDALFFYEEIESFATPDEADHIVEADVGYDVG